MYEINTLLLLPLKIYLIILNFKILWCSRLHFGHIKQSFEILCCSRLHVGHVWQNSEIIDFIKETSF